MNKTIQTKYGRATIGNNGYYQITSQEEGNYNKLLHRLIYEDVHNITLSEDMIIHHKDENKLNNELENLTLITRADHIKMHKPHKYVDHEKLGAKRRGMKFPKEWRDNISKGKKGLKLGESTRINMSKNKNTSGFYCVSTKPCPKCKQGFSWIYQYYDENIKHHAIHSVNLIKLKEKVLAKGLDWFIISEESAKNTCEKYRYDFKELT